MKTCPFDQCKSTGFTELSELPGHYLCRECKEIFTEEQMKEIIRNNDDLSVKKSAEPLDLSNDTDWFKSIGEDDELWFSGSLENFPSIIAYEYEQLRKFCREGSKYGAFLELKDVFEVLLKFPAIIYTALIYRKEDRSDEEKQLITDLLRKMLSLGDWHSAANRIKKFSDQLPAVKALLSDAAAIFNKHKIVNWRNSAIGHGATFLEFDEEFRNDYIKKLEALKKHFSQFADKYEAVSLVGKSNRETAVLSSPDKARNLDHENLSLYIETDDEMIPLSPFLIYEEGRIFFFDSYEQRRGRTHNLNYPDGRKNTFVNPEISDLFESLEIEQDYKSFTSSALDETWRRQEREVLEKIANVDDYKRAAYLEEELKQRLDADDRGVVLLQMERGMGKTTFSRALDQNSINKNKIFDEDTAIVRGYYCNSTFQGRTRTFTDMLPVIFNTDNEGRLLLEGSIPVLDAESGDKSGALADFLNNMFRMYKENISAGIEKCVLVIDGLDELTLDEEYSIFDFIPAKDQLEEGVYIILTSRVDEELKDKTQNRVTELKNNIDEKNCIRYAVNSESNIDLVTGYLKKELKQLNDEQLKTIIEKTGGRFLYLKLAKEMIMSYGEKEIDKLPGWEEMILYYLSRRRELYGEKHFRELILTALVIASAYEPLTVNEIAYMINESVPTFQLLAHLTELRGLLNTDRSTYRGALYSINAETVRDKLTSEYGSIFRERIADMISRQLKQLDPGAVIFDDEGQTYFITYLPDYMDEFKLNPEFDKQALAEFYFDAAGGVNDESAVRFLLVRKLHWYRTCIKLYDETGDNEELARTYMNRGITLDILTRFPEAYKDYSRSIEIREKLYDEGKLSYPNDLSQTYMNRGLNLSKQGSLEESLRDYNRCIEIKVELYKAEKLDDLNDLALAFMNRGNTLDFAGRYEDAFEDFNSCVEIREDLYSEGMLEEPDDLAQAYLNRGVNLNYLKKHEEALTDYDKCIELRENLLKNDQFENINNLASAYMNRGVNYSYLNRYEEAFHDQDRAVKIREALFSEGRLHDMNELAIAYMNRASVLINLNALDKALDDLNKGIKVYEDMIESGDFYYFGQLSNAYMSRISTLQKLEKYEESFEERDRIVNMFEDMYRQGDASHLDKLGTLYHRRGADLFSIGKYQEAFNDYNGFINVAGILYEKGIQFEPQMSADALYYRGIIYYSAKQYDKALEDLNGSINIMNSLMNDGREVNFSILSNAMHGKATVLSAMEKYDEALAELDTCIELNKELNSRGMLEDMNDLAAFYSMRGGIYMHIEMYSEAVDDYNKCIAIKTKLVENEELKEPAELAQAYKNRAAALAAAGNTSEAEEDARSSLELYDILIKNGRDDLENELQQLNNFLDELSSKG